MLDRSIAPLAGAIHTPNIQKPDIIPFSNGSTLYLINAGDQPVAKLEIIVKSGIWNETLPGLSWITAKMLPEGSAEKSANQIIELFEFYGSFIEISPGFDNTSLTVYCPKKYFEKAVGLLAEILFAPSFNEKELEILKTNKIQQLKVNNEKTSFIASRKTREALFGLNHPYGRSLSEGEVQGLNKTDIQNYFTTHFNIGAGFFLSGMVGDEEVATLKSHFDLRLTKSSPPDNTFEPINTQNIFIEKPESVQSSIRLAWKIPGKGHPEHFNLVVLNEILGGYFSSRLMKNLREDKGYTYSVHSYPVFLLNDSFLIISADVIAGNTNDAIGEVHKELGILKKDVVPEAELDTVKNYMAGSFLTGISSPFQLMEKFKSVHAYNLDYSYFEGFFDTLKNITQKDILETANEYFQIEKLHTIVVGKK